MSRTAPAVIDALRLPAVPAPKPVTAVSPWIVLTSSIATPSASAVSCTTVVSKLVPVEPPAMYTFTVPDGLRRTIRQIQKHTIAPTISGIAALPRARNQPTTRRRRRWS